MKAQFTERKFEYKGPPVLTRGDYGEDVRRGFNTLEDDLAIFVFDCTVGEMCWISIEAGLECGDWVEIDV